MIIDTAFALAGKVGTLLLKECKFVIAYKQELKKLQKNLQLACAYLEDAESSPSRTSLMSLFMNDIECLVSKADRLVKVIDKWVKSHEQRRNKVVKCIDRTPVVKFMNPVVLLHHYIEGRHLCSLNQGFKDLRYEIKAYSPMVQMQEQSNMRQQQATFFPFLPVILCQLIQMRSDQQRQQQQQQHQPCSNFNYRDRASFETWNSVLSYPNLD